MKLNPRTIARALGADEVIHVGKARSPLEMVGLALQILQLRSTGPRGSGRPTWPAATLSRLVKFKPKTWNWLHQLARKQSRKTGRRVSPGQVASLLIEQAVLRIRE